MNSVLLSSCLSSISYIDNLALKFKAILDIMLRSHVTMADAEHSRPIRQLLCIVRHSSQPSGWNRDPSIEQRDLAYGRQAMDVYWAVHRANHANCHCDRGKDIPTFVINSK